MLIYIVFAVIASIFGFIVGVLIGRQHKKPIGTLTLNQGITGNPPLELRIYEDPNEIKSGELVTFELIVKE